MIQIVDARCYELPIIEWAEGKPTCVVGHETANNSDNGSYENEIEYMKEHWENAFVHTFSDEQDSALFHDSDIGGAWGAGPSMHHYAIHCELCRSNNKEGFTKAYNNWVETLVYFAQKYDIPVMLNQGREKEGILTHKYVTETYGGTSHQDPKSYLERWGVTIDQLDEDIQCKAGGDFATIKPKGESKPVNLNKKVSIVDYLRIKGMDSSFSNRAELAKEYGIENYVGSKEQNTLLLNLTQQGIIIESGYEGNSIVAYLNSIGEDSNYNHREELAKVYGIGGYIGSVEQNLKLLDMLRSGVEPKTSNNGKTLYLPASANFWRVYKLNVQPVSQNSKWSLTPSAFGGLNYEVLARPYPNIVTIRTSRGKRNIYVAPSTGAIIK